MKVVYSRDLGEEFIEQVHEIDALSYNEGYLDSNDSDVARFLRNKDSFILIEDAGKYVGYVNFFPMTEQLTLSVLFESEDIRDCDITPEEIADWSRHDIVYLMSIAIIPEYRNGEAIKLLTSAFKKFLFQKGTSKLIATTVSKDGEKIAKMFNLSYVRTLSDENEKVFMGEV